MQDPQKFNLHRLPGEDEDQKLEAIEALAQNVVDGAPGLNPRC